MTTRSLATVLFTDIVGSTERAAELRDAGWREMRQEHDRRVRRELRRFGGREINTAGDSFLATFEGPARAIACADAIRAAVRELGLEIRAGLHMGEIEGAGRELGGLALNIGARVAAEAGPGEILVSRSVHDALAGSAFDFEDMGVRTLKGVPGEWRLFIVTNMPAETGEALPGRLQRLPLTRRRVLLGSAATAALLLGGLYIAQRELGPELTAEDAFAANAAPGIAVLPFSVRGEGLDVWREGMVDILSTNLDGAAGLRTIDSRTVLARWGEGVEGDRSSDLAAALDVARHTGARYALIGGVIASGAGVRFGADIYDVRDGSKLGEAQVEGSPDSLFSLVDRLSIEVLQAIYGEESSDLPRMQSLASVTTDSLSALKAYLEGEVLFRSGDFGAATAAYERAIAADSTFALAIKRLVDAKGWTHENVSDVEFERAIEVIDRLPAREALLLVARRDGLRHLDALRQAVQRYPDDPDFWFALGDMYFHNPEHLLVELDEAERVLSRALALDPGFAAFYEHPIDIGFHKADSARVASLIQAFDRIASKRNAYRTEFAIAFGDSADRSRALAALDSPPILDALFTGVYLIHPRFGPIQEQLLRRVLARPDAEPWMRQQLFYNLLRRGRFRVAIEYLESEPWPNFGPRDAYRYFIFRPGSAPMPERMEQELTGSAMADGSEEFRAAFPWRRDFYTGAYAADRGQWPAYNAAVGRLRDDAGRLEAAGDSVLARDHAVAAQALGAYGRWKRGHAAEALPVLEAAFQEVTAPNEMIKWWLGELSLEIGRRQEAAVYFASIWVHDTGTGVGVFAPLAASRLGEIYADLGEFEKARESYEYALLAWRDADPEMKPRIEAARQGLGRLPKPLRREGS